MDVFPLAESILEHNFTLKCVVTPLPKLRQILPYLTLEWIKPTADIITGLQTFSTDNTSRELQFDPLTWSHGGMYTCRVRLNIPNSVGNYVTTRNFHLNIFSKSSNIFVFTNKTFLHPTDRLHPHSTQVWAHNPLLYLAQE